MRAPEAASANARSSPFSRAAPASRSWLSSRSAASGSPSTTPRGGSCGRRYRVAPRAARKAAEARTAAGTALRDATQARAPVRAAENLKRRAEGQLAAAETKLGAGISGEAKEQAEDTKAQAVAKIAELQLQWDVANVD